MRLILVPVVLLLSACASTGGGRKVAKADLPTSLTLGFSGKPGEISETRYYSNSRTRNYDMNQMVRDHLEAVDFTVVDHVEDFNPKNGLLKFEVRTVRKDGSVDLHDLAFPELNETIPYVERSNGEVLVAGRYPPQSLFFVPSLPIPDHPVAVGDTWTMDHAWLSSKDGIPLKLEVVAILKDIVSCEDAKVCADIEISGHVVLGARPTEAGARFDSRVRGRVLFSLARGDVLWSEMRSEESMGAASQATAVNSCMISEMKSGAKYKLDFNCDPNVPYVKTVPAY